MCLRPLEKPQIHPGAKLCTTNVTMPNSRYRMMNSSWMGKRVQIHLAASLFTSTPVVFGSMRRWHAVVAFDQLMETMKLSSAPWHEGFYLLLSQVSQPGTEHLKEALTLLWISLTWFMWAGWGFESLLWHSVFQVRLFMRIWRWVLRARGCSLKQRYTTSGWAWSLTTQNLPLDESLVAHLIPKRTWCTRPLILVTERNLRAD